MTEYIYVLSTFDWSTFWSAVSAIFTAITSIAIIFAIMQIRFDAWLRAQEIFVEDNFRNARATVFSLINKPMKEWSSDEKKAAMKVCQKMDELVHLSPYLSKRRILENWDDPLGKSWLALEPFVKKEREDCNWPDKWKEFEKYGSKALQKLIKLGRDPRILKKN